MAITKAEELVRCECAISGAKQINSIFRTSYTDDSTDPDTVVTSERFVTYTKDDTIPNSEDKMIKDLAAVLFA